MKNNDEFIKSRKESLQNGIPKINYISLFFVAIIYTIWMLVLVGVVGFILCLLFRSEGMMLFAIGAMFLTLIIAPIRYIRGEIRSFKEQYQHYKDKTTCPKCKKPFVWAESYSQGEVLSKDYKTQNVRVGRGENAYNRRGVFVYGQVEEFHRGFCLECGHRTERKAIGQYEQEV